MENYVQINFCGIKRKLNSKKVIIGFIMERGYCYPPFSSYNYKFFLKVLKKVNF